MYGISRRIKIDKAFTDELINKFNQPSPIFNFKGFIKREILIDKKDKSFNIVNISTYFEDKQAFYKWEGSAEHIQMHKDKNHMHHQKPEGVIGVEFNHYELALLNEYEEKKA